MERKEIKLKQAKALESYWLESFAPGRFGKLQKNLQTDVLIIGGGIAGLTTAYLLSQAGRKVVVVDRNLMGTGDSGHTTAHLTIMTDPGYAQIKRRHGKEAACLVLESHVTAIRLIESIVEKESIECHLRRIDGYLFSGKKQDRKEMGYELEALKAAGCPDAYWLLGGSAPPCQDRPVICLPKQARFHITRYLQGLMSAILAAGGKIYDSTPVQKVDSGMAMTEDGITIKANHIVVATHAPIVRELTFLKQAAYRTYAAGFRIPKGSIKDALYWDTEDPYHYVRLEEYDSHNDLLIVGGEDHKTGQIEPEEYARPFEALEQWTSSRFGAMRHCDYRWSGQVLETMDGLPYIGKLGYRSDAVYIATGFSGNGMTYGTFAGMLVRDLVLGRKNGWSRLYDPSRKNPASIHDFLAENLNVARALIGEWVKKPGIETFEEVRPGEGGIAGCGLKKFAAYRSPGGTLNLFSAVCPHLGCAVQWNSAEKTFDCPCHGSRFGTDGQVVNGPAHKSLKRVKSPE